MHNFFIVGRGVRIRNWIRIEGFVADRGWYREELLSGIRGVAIVLEHVFHELHIATADHFSELWEINLVTLATRGVSNEYTFDGLRIQLLPLLIGDVDEHCASEHT